MVGVEPTSPKALVSKTSMFANFITLAWSPLPASNRFPLLTRQLFYIHIKLRGRLACLLGFEPRIARFRRPARYPALDTLVGTVGLEPTSRRLKAACNADFCYAPIGGSTGAWTPNLSLQHSCVPIYTIPPLVQVERFELPPPTCKDGILPLY